MMRDAAPTTIIVLAALVVAAVAFPTITARASDGARVRVEPAQVEVLPNEAFQVQVVVEGISDLGGFEFELAYDPTVLEVKDVAFGDFLGTTGRSVIPVGPALDDEEGMVAIGAATFGEQPGPSGAGVLATISYVARRAGSSELRLQNAVVLDSSASLTPIETADGRVAVQEPAAPATASTAVTASAVPTAPPSGEGASPVPPTVAVGGSPEAATTPPTAPTSPEGTAQGAQTPTAAPATVPPTRGDGAAGMAQATPSASVATTPPMAEATGHSATGTVPPSPSAGPTLGLTGTPEPNPSDSAQGAVDIRWALAVVALVLVAAGAVALRALGRQLSG
ncbi:MAG: cohesin domain-containing protein [Anaerolineae bacterium]|jgi:hypothetical protein